MVLNILRRQAVEKATGLSRSSIYERMARGIFQACSLGCTCGRLA